MDTPRTWRETDLQALVDAREPESLVLEFKALKALGGDSTQRNELSKDVSAMANSAGGTIIYGIRERKVGATPVAADLDDDPEAPRVTAETLEQRILGSIQPRPHGLSIQTVPLQNGNVAIVVTIPAASSQGPHQASDRKYYRRFNFQCEPMHDYEIRDVMRRASVPELHVSFSPIATSEVAGEEDLMARVRVSIANRSPEPAPYYAITLFVDHRFPWTRVDNQFNEGAMTAITTLKERFMVNTFQRNFLPSAAMPIFREGEFHVAEIKVRHPRATRRFVLGYQVITPGFSGEGRTILETAEHGMSIIDLTGHQHE